MRLPPPLHHHYSPHSAPSKNGRSLCPILYIYTYINTHTHTEAYNFPIIYIQRGIQLPYYIYNICIRRGIQLSYYIFTHTHTQRYITSLFYICINRGIQLPYFIYIHIYIHARERHTTSIYIQRHKTSLLHIYIYIYIYIYMCVCVCV